MKQLASILLALILLLSGLATLGLAQSDDYSWETGIALESLRQGRELHEKGQVQEAIAQYDKALESGLLRDDNRAIAYNNRGNALADLNRFEEAVADYSDAISLNPGFVEAYYNRGIGRYRLGEYLGAVDDFSKVLELEPGYVSAYYNRSFPLAGLGRYHDAIKDVGQAIMMRPERTAYKDRLQVLQKMARELEGK